MNKDFNRRDGSRMILVILSNQINSLVHLELFFYEIISSTNCQIVRIKVTTLATAIWISTRLMFRDCWSLPKFLQIAKVKTPDICTKNVLEDNLRNFNGSLIVFNKLVCQRLQHNQKWNFLNDPKDKKTCVQRRWGRDTL